MPKKLYHPVLDHGELQLEDQLGDELSICDAARVSTGRNRRVIAPAIEHRDPTEADQGLIRYLLKNRHGTPFEHVVFTFRVKAPIFVAREWFRHRVGSFNERSGRYSVYDCEFYIPENVRSQEGKPGAYRFADFDEVHAKAARAEFRDVHAVCLRAYNRLRELNVANELACRVLPTTLYTEWYWTVNARALMNFISLRTDETAQFEIRQYANLVEGEFARVLPVTHSAFVAANRTAP